ncbi:MAG: hypothetical protein ACYTAQ_03585 [Planctomycetota bacterium]
MLRAGHGIVLIVCALLAIGVVMVTSAGLTIDADRSVSLPQILRWRWAPCSSARGYPCSASATCGCPRCASAGCKRRPHPCLGSPRQW